MPCVRAWSTHPPTRCPRWRRRSPHSSTRFTASPSSPTAYVPVHRDEPQLALRRAQVLVARLVFASAAYSAEPAARPAGPPSSRPGRCRCWQRSRWLTWGGRDLPRPGRRTRLPGRRPRRAAGDARAPSPWTPTAATPSPRSTSRPPCTAGWRRSTDDPETPLFFGRLDLSTDDRRSATTSAGGTCTTTPATRW